MRAQIEVSNFNEFLALYEDSKTKEAVEYSLVRNGKVTDHCFCYRLEIAALILHWDSMWRWLLN